MAVKSVQTPKSKQVLRPPTVSAGQASSSNWGMVSSWPQLIVLQQQWLHEWWLGMLSAAMQPARLISVIAPAARQRVVVARRQLGCLGVADLADAGRSSGDQLVVTEANQAVVGVAPSGSGATSGSTNRRARRAAKTRSG